MTTAFSFVLLGVVLVAASVVFLVVAAVKTKQFRWYSYVPVCVAIFIVLGLILLSGLPTMQSETIRRNERFMQLRHKQLHHK